VIEIRNNRNGFAYKSKKRVETQTEINRNLYMQNIESLHWSDIFDCLDTSGFAVINNLLSVTECNALIADYSDSKLYRNTIDMQRYRFGNGEYKYFSYPLPVIVARLRTEMYAHLAPLANTWMQRLGIEFKYPAEHHQLIELCHRVNQTRPTPLILRYETGGYNTLHQDLYGEVYFPFQLVVLLRQPQRDFSGGELVMVEQLPRAQPKAQAINLQMGDALIFTTNFRPVLGTRGYYKAKVKHGVSPLTSGTRYAMGVIFRDAN
jgi:uncharacterized protein